jgi:hypothetical protein
MKKSLFIGTARGEGRVFVDVEIEDKGDGKKRLSMSGVVGPMSNGDCRGSCGQIELADISDWAPGWDLEKARELWRVWGAWHLNDMKAGCEHQRADGWDKGEKKIDVETWTIFPYTYQRKRAIDESNDPAECARLGEEIGRAQAAFLRACGSNTLQRRGRHLWDDQDRADMAKYGSIEKTESKSPIWTYPTEHPEGILGKPCPKCDYKYGSAWLYEPLPPAIIAYLESLPVATVRNPWDR